MLINLLKRNKRKRKQKEEKKRKEKGKKTARGKKDAIALHTCNNQVETRKEKKRKQRKIKKSKKTEKKGKKTSKKKKKEKNTIALHGCSTQAPTDEQSLRIVCVIGCQKFIWLS